MNEFTIDEPQDLEFTIEELQDLESTILGMRVYTGIELWDDQLLMKIRDMINNYCDHEFHLSGSNGNTLMQCFKCGKLDHAEIAHKTGTMK